MHMQQYMNESRGGLIHIAGPPKSAIGMNRLSKARASH